MPFIRVTHSAAIDTVALDALASRITALMRDVLGKKAELTSVLIERSMTQVWTVGGQTAGSAAHLEAIITKGTNTVEQKADFIRQAMEALSTAAGTLPLATYVVVREIPAEDWGYGGLTQAARRLAALPL